MPRRTITAALICALIIAALYAVWPRMQPASHSAASFAPAEIQAWTDCAHFVRKHLEARSSAQFPPIADPQVAVVLLATNQWLVHGYVDVRDDDDTGARLRTSFLCQVNFQPATLTVQQITIGDPEQLDS